MPHCLDLVRAPFDISHHDDGSMVGEHERERAFGETEIQRSGRGESSLSITTHSHKN
jgi:hypothetical protein